MTAEGTVVGTPDYMSPEQARGAALDFRSDIYSTGVVLYEVFTGTLPFEGDTPLAVVLKHIQENPPSPQARNPKIDPKISQIVLKCMQKDPKDRYQSVNELYEALTQGDGVKTAAWSRRPGRWRCRGERCAPRMPRPSTSRSRTVPSPHFTLQWDFARALRQRRALAVPPAIERGRFEVRPEVDFALFADLPRRRARVFDYGTEPNELQRVLRGQLRSRAGPTSIATTSRGRPAPWTFQAGAFALPVAASEMLWDKYDIQTPGASLSYVKALSPTSSLTFTAAGIYSAQHGPRRVDPRRRTGALEVGRREPLRDPGLRRPSGTWTCGNVASQYFRENRVDDRRRKARSTSRSSSSSTTLVRLQFPVACLPVTVSLDFIHNFGIVGRGPNAYEAGVDGRARSARRGHWRAFFVYQYIGRDALVGAYNTDDWWWHTWAEGYRFGRLVHHPADGLHRSPPMVVQRRLDLDYWVNRVMVERREDVLTDRVADRIESTRSMSKDADRLRRGPLLPLEDRGDRATSERAPFASSRAKELRQRLRPTDATAAVLLELSSPASLDAVRALRRGGAAAERCS